MQSFFKGSPSNSNGGAVEGVDYVLINADNRGGQNKVKVYNFDNPNLCKRSGLIELVPMREKRGVGGTPLHDNWLRFSYAVDKVNGIVIGIPNGYDDKTGRLTYKKIQIADTRIFDLSKTDDAMEWAVVKNHPLIQGSPFAKGKPKYKVYDKEKQAEEFIALNATKRKAETIADGLWGDSLIEMGRNIGKNVESMSPTVLHAEVIKFAEEMPKRFMEIWESPTRHEFSVFNRAKAVGVITHDLLLGFCYGSVPLGTHESRCVDFLKENPQLCQTIYHLSLTKENDSVKAMGGDTKPVEINDEKDVAIARQNSEIEQLKQMVKKLSEKQAEKAVTDVDPEWQELWDRAKGKVQGYKLIKDKEKLRKKIEEVEQGTNN